MIAESNQLLPKTEGSILVKEGSILVKEGSMTQKIIQNV